MPIKRKTHHRRVPDPFDDSAPARLARMGVLTADGKINPEILPVFAGIFCGLFYDDFADFYADNLEKRVAELHGALLKLRARREYQHMYVLLCVQYDAIWKPLPDPVWWLAGNPDAVEMFMDCFTEKLADFVNQNIQQGESI